MAEQTGLAAVLADVGAGEAAFDDDREQLALLGLAIPASKRVAGRPAGRRNLRNQRVADFILATVGDPLVELARMSMLPVDALAAALCVTASEAFAEKRLCLVALMPYVHQRQAIAVDVSNRSIVHLSIFEGAAGQGLGGGDDQVMTISAGLADIVENQEVSDER